MLLRGYSFVTSILIWTYLGKSVYGQSASSASESVAVLSQTELDFSTEATSVDHESQYDDITLDSVDLDDEDDIQAEEAASDDLDTEETSPADVDTEETPSESGSLPEKASLPFSAEDLERGELPVYREATATVDNDMPPVPQVTGCRTHGQIALTYSEGPSDATAKIVRQLNNAQVRGNFFINTTWLYTQQYAMVVQNMYNAGHLIGMTYRTPKHDDGSSFNDKELRQDIINSASMIETLIQVAPKYVRLHATETEDTRAENIIKDLGFVLVDYNLDSLDYLHKSNSKIRDVYRNAFRRQKDTYDAKGSFISVQYDIPGSGSLTALPYVIQTIDEEGYTAVRMDGCLNDPKPYKASADSLDYVNDKFSYNTTGYKQGQRPVAILSNAAEDDERGLSIQDEVDEEYESKANSMHALLGWTASFAFVAAIVHYF